MFKINLSRGEFRLVNLATGVAKKFNPAKRHETHVVLCQFYNLPLPEYLAKALVNVHCRSSVSESQKTDVVGAVKALVYGELHATQKGKLLRLYNRNASEYWHLSKPFSKAAAAALENTTAFGGVYYKDIIDELCRVSAA